MEKSEKTNYCPCCGLTKPAYDYAPGLLVCSLCAMLDNNSVVKLTRETVRREAAITEFTALGKREARIAKRLALYAGVGKRCTACHNRKPVSEFNACAPQSDGLQPMCKTCHTLWMASRRSGGPAAWHAVRAAMRAASPEGE